MYRRRTFFRSQGRNHYGKRKCWISVFSPFPMMFLKAFFLEMVKTYHCLVNPFPIKPSFSHVCSKSLLKTLWEKEKLLVIFSPFPTVFSILSENFPPFSSKSKLSSANSFSLEKLKICCLGKG